VRRTVDDFFTLHITAKQPQIYLVFLAEIMADAVLTPNVIEATNKKGLYERFEGIQASRI